MGLRKWLGAIASRADARVFVVAGSRARDEARALRLVEGLELELTPRAANVLVVVGRLDAGLVVPALVAHDALAPPRATVWWRLDAHDTVVRQNFPHALVVDDAEPGPALRRIQQQLVTGRRDSEPTLLPDVDPVQWRGLGPYGQGGKGMTGGLPYGRPMAERAEARDGLKLDQLPVRVGPLFAPFPSGLALDVKLQGDVIEQATVENFADAMPRSASIFHRSLRQPLPVRELELARARSHLEWVSDAVAVAGAASLSAKILRLAGAIRPQDGDAVRALARSLARRGFLSWGTRGVGVLQPDRLQEVTGPAARASAVPIDARSEDPAYRRLGFEPVLHDRGDAAARWSQRLAEAAQALDLAERSDHAGAGGSGVVESPRGVLTHDAGPSRATVALVPSLIAGMGWGDAVATIVSLDLDMIEAHALGSQTSAAS